jgi:hypothetical protein
LIFLTMGLNEILYCKFFARYILMNFFHKQRVVITNHTVTSFLQSPTDGYTDISLSGQPRY